MFALCEWVCRTFEFKPIDDSYGLLQRRLFKFPWLFVRCFSPTRSQHVDHGIQLSSRDVCCMFDPRSETKQDVVITGAIPRVPHWELLSFCMFLTTHVELNVLEKSRAVFAELFEAHPPHTGTKYCTYAYIVPCSSYIRPLEINIVLLYFELQSGTSLVMSSIHCFYLICTCDYMSYICKTSIKILENYRKLLNICDDP